MSSVYIQEPQTSGKVLLKTTHGDIDIELWSKEVPLACRNFVQLCMEGYYNGTVFHRVVKNFIIQGGDPTGSGHGGESIFGKPFKDEFHQRLKFSRRGLVAMANSEPNDNGSQFFITLDKAPELEKKHTIFGKVTGNTIFNVVSISELPCVNDRPVNPPRIIGAEILSNPFEDIVPRAKKEAEVKRDQRKESKSRATKNFGLMSFGDEAENEESEVVESAKAFGKIKSLHDVDPKLKSKLSGDLSSEPQGNQIEPEPSSVLGEKRKRASDSDLVSKANSEEEGEQGSSQLIIPQGDGDELSPRGFQDEEDDETSYDMAMRSKVLATKGKSEKEQKKQAEKEKPDTSFSRPSKQERIQASKKEAEQLLQEMRDAKKRKEEKGKGDDEGEATVTEASSFLTNERLQYVDQNSKYKKGDKSARESLTLSILAKFQKKLGNDAADDGTTEGAEDRGWLNHTLENEVELEPKKIAPELNPNQLDISDPRNPMNVRRRKEHRK